MNDLIYRQAAISTLNDEVTITGKSNAIMFMDYVRKVNRRLEQLPATDAVPVVRCKDCIYSKEDPYNGIWCDRLTGTFKVEKEGYCKWAKT